MQKKRRLTVFLLSFLSAFLLIGCLPKNQDNINITKNSDKTEVNNQILEKKEDNQNLNLYLVLSIVANFIFAIAIFIGFIALKNQSEDRKKMNDAFKTAFKESKNDIKDLQDSIEQIKGKIKRRDEKISLLKAELEKVNKQKDDISLKPLITQIDSNIDIDDNLQLIYTRFQEIDKQIKELEKASQRIIISGGKSNPQPKPINVSEDELINVYNYAPQVLAEYATPVSISVENYKNKNQENVYLEYTINGFYWVILREENNEKKYYLVPNGNKKFNLHRLQNLLENLFFIRGERDTNNNNFSLEKLPSLEILPSGFVWQLINQGIIKIGAISPINKLLRDLEKINTQSGQIPDNINNLLSLVYENYQDSNTLKDQQKNLEIYVFETINKLLEIKNKLEENFKKLEVNFHNQKYDIKQLEEREENYNKKIDLIDETMNELKQSLVNLEENFASVSDKNNKTVILLEGEQQNLKTYIIETINKFLELKNNLEENIDKLKTNLDNQKQEIQQLKQNAESGIK